MEVEAASPVEIGQLLQNVGNTPLVELKLARDYGARLFAKLESVNPGGSIQDRPAARIILQALADGRFEDGRGLLDCVSGNAGISLAMLGAAAGIAVTLVIAGHASQEQIDRMAAHGAQLVVMDPLAEHADAIAEAERLADAFPTRYWRCDQRRNPANWQSHYYGTAVEMLKQLAQTPSPLPDAFVTGVDTGGTLTGMGRRLREASSNIHIAVVVPQGFPGIESLKPLGQLNDVAPALFHQYLIHERIPVTLEQARLTCRRLAKEGLFVGPSSGAYVYGALKLAATGRYRNIVTVLPDTGERYTSTGMWHREWRAGAASRELKE